MVLDLQNQMRKTNSRDTAYKVTEFIAYHDAVEWPLILEEYIDFPHVYELTFGCTFALIFYLMFPQFLADIILAVVLFMGVKPD
jgi:hypothetical protein